MRSNEFDINRMWAICSWFKVNSLFKVFLNKKFVLQKKKIIKDSVCEKLKGWTYPSQILIRSQLISFALERRKWLKTPIAKNGKVQSNSYWK